MDTFLLILIIVCMLTHHSSFMNFVSPGLPVLPTPQQPHCLLSLFRISAPADCCFLLVLPELVLTLSNLTFCTRSYIPHTCRTPQFTFNSAICNKVICSSRPKSNPGISSGQVLKDSEKAEGSTALPSSPQLRSPFVSFQKTSFMNSMVGVRVQGEDSQVGKRVLNKAM